MFADPAGRITDPAARAAVEATLAGCAGARTCSASPAPTTGPARQPRRPHRLHDRPLRVDPPGKAEGKAAEAAVETRRAGLQAEISRTIIRTAEPVEGREGIGLIVAVVVLLVAFGSVIAAGIPIATALFGIFIGLGLIGVLAGLTDVRRSHPSSPR